MPNSGLTKKGHKGGRHRKPVDMSLAPEDRRHIRKGAAAKGAVAQMSHATNPRARKKQREGEKQMHRDKYAHKKGRN